MDQAVSCFFMPVFNDAIFDIEAISTAAPIHWPAESIEPCTAKSRSIAVKGYVNSHIVDTEAGILFSP